MTATKAARGKRSEQPNAFSCVQQCDESLESLSAFVRDLNSVDIFVHYGVEKQLKQKLDR